MRKSVGMVRLSKKSYKNTRTKKSECPCGRSDFLMSDGTRKGVKKTVRWTVFREVGESLRFETHPVGMWIKLEQVRCRKTLVRRTFSKSHISPLAPSQDNPNLVFLVGDGFGLFVSMHIGLSQQTIKLVFVDFRTRSVFAVGEALMPPAYTLRFRLTVRKIGTFHRREA